MLKATSYVQLDEDVIMHGYGAGTGPHILSSSLSALLSNLRFTTALI
jgi:hypothetical protein